MEMAKKEQNKKKHFCPIYFIAKVCLCITEKKLILKTLWGFLS